MELLSSLWTETAIPWEVQGEDVITIRSTNAVSMVDCYACRVSVVGIFCPSTGYFDMLLVCFVAVDSTKCDAFVLIIFDCNE